MLMRTMSQEFYLIWFDLFFFIFRQMKNCKFIRWLPLSFFYYFDRIRDPVLLWHMGVLETIARRVVSDTSAAPRPGGGAQQQDDQGELRGVDGRGLEIVLVIQNPGPFLQKTSWWWSALYYSARHSQTTYIRPLLNCSGTRRAPPPRTPPPN